MTKPTTAAEAQRQADAMATDLATKLSADLAEFGIKVSASAAVDEATRTATVRIEIVPEEEEPPETPERPQDAPDPPAEGAEPAEPLSPREEPQDDPRVVPELTQAFRPEEAEAWTEWARTSNTWGPEEDELPQNIAYATAEQLATFRREMRKVLPEWPNQSPAGPIPPGLLPTTPGERAFARCKLGQHPHLRLPRVASGPLMSRDETLAGVQHLRGLHNAAHPRVRYRVQHRGQELHVASRGGLQEAADRYARRTYGRRCYAQPGGFQTWQAYRRGERGQAPQPIGTRFALWPQSNRLEIPTEEEPPTAP